MQVTQRRPGQAEVSTGLCYHVILQIACIKSTVIDQVCFDMVCIDVSTLNEVAVAALSTLASLT